MRKYPIGYNKREAPSDIGESEMVHFNSRMEELTCSLLGFRDTPEGCVPCEDLSPEFPLKPARPKKERGAAKGVARYMTAEEAAIGLARVQAIRSKFETLERLTPDAMPVLKFPTQVKGRPGYTSPAMPVLPNWTENTSAWQDECDSIRIAAWNAKATPSTRNEPGEKNTPGHTESAVTPPWYTDWREHVYTEVDEVSAFKAWCAWDPHEGSPEPKLTSSTPIRNDSPDHTPLVITPKQVVDLEVIKSVHTHTHIGAAVPQQPRGNLIYEQPLVYDHVSQGDYKKIDEEDLEDWEAESWVDNTWDEATYESTTGKHLEERDGRIMTDLGGAPLTGHLAFLNKCTQLWRK